MKKAFICIFCLLSFCMQMFADDPVLNKIIDLDKSKGSVYELLNQVSEASGMLFIYDGKVIDNDQKTKIAGGKTTLKQAILTITQKPELGMKVLGNHILLYITETPLPKQETPVSPDSAQTTYFSIEGIVRDKETREPLPFSSVGISENGIGTVTNQNGQFLLKIPDSLTNASLSVYYVGYETQKIPIQLLTEGLTDIYMAIRIVPIQEVIVSIVNPLKIVRDMIDNREKNYANNPVCQTTFYREGIDRKNDFINLTEAVFKVYKTDFNSEGSDRVKLLKMRKIINKQENDSILMKFKAGVDASISLDIIKNLPDFLSLDGDNPYDYTKIDMTVIDSRLVHVIAFEQKAGIKEPLYKGELYIDAENAALLNARFEINLKYIKKAKSLFVVKQSKGMDITPKEINYTVSYKEWNGKYYLNYVRGDLDFLVKKKSWLLSQTKTIHTYFEMVACRTDLENVKPFPLKESIPTTKVFSETRFIYDQNFWDDFNIILPEQKLSDDIARISAKIEESIE